MSSDAITPSTTIQEPGIRGLPRLYVSMRAVPAEYLPPARGAALGSQFGAAYAANIIIDAKIDPKGSQRVLTILHCTAPDWISIFSTENRLTGTGEYLFSDQIVLAPTRATMEADVFAEYSPINEAIWSRRLKIPRKKLADGTYVDGYPFRQVKRNGVFSTVPEKFKKFVTSILTESTVALPQANVDDIPAPETPTGNIIGIEHKKLNDDQYQRGVTQEVIDGSVAPLEGQKTDSWGVNTTEESYVAEGTATEFGFGVKEGAVTPTGNGKAIKQTERYPGVIATLQAQEQDETTAIVIDIEKDLIDAATAKATAAAKRAEQWFVELKPLDKWHTIMMASKIDPTTIPASQTWKETGTLNLPNQLVEVGVIWDSDINGVSGYGDAGSISDIIDNDISWTVSAEASVVGSVFARPYTKTKAGKQGAAEVTVVRTFHLGPPADVITAHSFEAVYGHVTIYGAQGQMQSQCYQRGIGDILVSSGGSGRRNLDTKMAIHDFGPIEHPGTLTLVNLGDASTISGVYETTGGSTPDGGFYPSAVADLNITGSATLELPASSIPLVSGNTYIRHVEVKPWRFGYWIREVYTIYVP